jgi:hypothetical protein
MSLLTHAEKSALARRQFQAAFINIERRRASFGRSGIRQQLFWLALLLLFGKAATILLG